MRMETCRGSSAIRRQLWPRRMHFSWWAGCPIHDITYGDVGAWQL